MERLYRHGGLIEVTRVHAYCNTPLRIGVQDDAPFHYCPRCLVRVAPAYPEDAQERAD